MTNRLAQETSPYLLQHKDNPVDWYPWSDEAIEKARQEDKPIFLSIGYSACHWCHVMEHESFEDESIATELNARFVPIKVDREERPDLDQIYMNAVQMLTGHGGWPMSVFLTPELKPFYGGTYWPPRATRGMPGFDQILTAVHDAWENRRQHALEGAEQITAELHKVSRGPTTDDVDTELSRELWNAAVVQIVRAYDATYGGFGSAPKFPHPMSLQLLLRQWHRTGQSHLLDIVRHTLDRMAAGGIYDQLGGGFARYSVDARWLVPHFEKMLYDNAQLAGVYIDAYLATGEQRYARIVHEVLDYQLREMTDPAGGFYSTEDADSEGEEGKFYTWTAAEIADVLGDETAATFCRVYGVSEEGNFEGRNILHLPKTLAQSAALLGRDEQQLARELNESRAKLFAVRSRRVRPGRDDKVLVAWNGLMIDTMARAGAVLGEPLFVQAAVGAAQFLLSQLRRGDGRLLHTWRQGSAKLNAYLDDYACLANALASLYESTGDERWVEESVALMDIVLDQFADPDGAGFFFTAIDQEALITRTKEFTDSSTPSGNGMAASTLWRLGSLLGRSDYLDAAGATLRAGAGIAHRAPMAAGHLLLALDMYLGPTYELLLVGGAEDSAVEQSLYEVRQRYLPNCIMATRLADSRTGSCHPSLLEEAFKGKVITDRQPTLYICRNFTCDAPAVGLDAIKQRLTELAR